ncbi:hypothetical protein ABZT03_43075 [Streptomyces sp. NPDC005574]|uniref:hypothetical protein n=1 Tax=Streptomyces sp. NPDC005574 TaxID=3156891 RepID=UPI0033BED446
MSPSNPGRFNYLLAEARRYLSYVLRGRPHQPGLDERIVQTVVDDYTRPVGRGLMMTADLHALYPRDTHDQAVLRPLTRNRTLPLYARARLAADALKARMHAARRAERLGSRSRPHTVAVPGTSRTGLRPSRPDREADRAQEQQQGTEAAALEQTRATIEAVAQMAARLQDTVRERAAARAARQQPAPPAPAPSHTPPPGAQPAPGRTPTGGFPMTLSSRGGDTS